MRLVALCPSVNNTLPRKLDIACEGSVLFRMSCDCLRAVVFLTLPWVGLQCVIVVISDHTHTVQLMHVNIAQVTTKYICSINDLLNTGASNDKQLEKFGKLTCPTPVKILSVVSKIPSPRRIKRTGNVHAECFCYTMR